MKQLICGSLMMLLVVTGFSARSDPALAADEDTALRFSDLQRMRADRLSHDEVLAQLRSEGTRLDLAPRGSDLQLEDGVQKRLLEMRFTEDQVQLIAWIGLQKSVYLPGDEIPWVGADEASQAVKEFLDETDVEFADFTPGYRFDAEARDGIDTKVKRALKQAGKLDKSPYVRFAVHGNAEAIKSLGPVMSDLDDEIGKRFPKALANVSNSQTLQIVLTNSSKAYAQTCAAFAKQMRYDRQYHSSKAFEDSYYWRTKHLVVIDAAQCDSVKEVGRLAAYGIGQSMIEHLLYHEHPLTIASGFANAVEALAYDSPSIIIEDFVEFKGDVHWGDILVRLKGIHEEIDTPMFLLNMSGSGVKQHLGGNEYAWVLTDSLLKDPKRYTQAMLLIQNRLLRPADAIRWAYGKDFPELNAEWAAKID